MSRRRYLSTDISTDTKVNRLAMVSDFAALLYTWMIPHCGDDATIHGNSEEIMLTVMPGRRDKSLEEFEAALALIEEAGLIAWDRNGKTVDYPPEPFYKHQSYIKNGERRGRHNSADQRKKEPISAESRKTAQNSASFKSSFKSSSSEDSEEKITPIPAKPRILRPPKEPDDGAKPFDVLTWLCEELGHDVSEISEAQKLKQLSAAKRLIADGATEEDIRREIRWLKSQAWVEVVDLLLIEKQRGKWQLAGKPESTNGAKERLSYSDARRYAGTNEGVIG